MVAWLDAQPAAQLYTSAVSRAEIELGLALMPAGKRQAALAQAAQAMFDDDFAGQCLPFDEAAASAYARIVAARTRAGRPIGVEDAQIAAITRRDVGTALQLVDRSSVVCIVTQMKSADLIKRLESEGWKHVGGKGDHMKFKHPANPGHVVVPHPRKDMAIGTLRNIYRQAGWNWR